MSKKVRVLGAFNAFKDTLSAEDVTNITLETLQRLYPEVEGIPLPLSDGGDGFLESLRKPFNLDIIKADVSGPLGNQIQAQWGFNGSQHLAVIEMASASGLWLVPTGQRNPLNTTTKGTGELISQAISAGCKRIILGVGGSATNDGGLGALAALGLKVYISDGSNGTKKCDTVTGSDLLRVSSIEVPEGGLIPSDVKIEIACDVNSPFVGPTGASHIFSPQKGASPTDTILLEEGMVRLAALYHKTSGTSIADAPGAGAAGGIAGGFMAMCNAVLKKGLEFVSEAHSLEDWIRKSDLVFTGEGMYDATSAAGKVPWKVIELGHRYNVPVVILCGKSIVKDSNVPIFQLVDEFPLEKCLTDASSCIRGLLEKRSQEFPLLKDLKKQ
eukprot:TRINITY_DN7842_c0_g1_i2.p1 TRINITY_DN7842_c0_g1~~TRINITY_DN7842_c0_g1_i2.p1  ORF type:complete len:385 (+),score=78.46 TRINITY_DN7842_c0_g1_i2:112-1266(+)